MIRRSAHLIALSAITTAAVALAACGGSGNGNATASTQQANAAKHATDTVDVANSNLGALLVDARGDTLYLFKKDTGTKSTCFGACAAAWPPLRSGAKPTAGAGATASLVAVTARPDGRPQVTYHGHPLYLFAGDTHPGDTKGQGVNAFGGRWLALSPAGNALRGQPPSSGGNSGY